ncbi:histidine phosphatase family protein [Maridesulfovibrio sp.]|uniref:histidine phosphatase family protein n=1 Tax=Maridesulfovibrio sp. TaxID=2795000 RepID=UPI0029F4B754|nr:histidine phosphatase family protein [Maridesulfovibrio sp.]
MIVLIRHGEIAGAKGRAVGQIDLSLSKTGLDQALQLAESLGSFRPRRIYCSPLTRTVQTSSFIENKCGLESSHIPEIKEISLGRWEGLEFKTIKSLFPDEFEKRGQNMADFRPPEGENFNDLQIRVRSFIERLGEESAIVVTHAGVIRSVLHIVLGFPLENIFRIKPDYCHVTVIEKAKQDFVLKAFNLPPKHGLGEHLLEMMRN